VCFSAHPQNKKKVAVEKKNSLLQGL